MPRAINDHDYAVLAEFRSAIRTFLHFSESKAAEAGLTAQQHQVLLAMRAAGHDLTIGELADRLHALGLCDRVESEGDRRRVMLRLTDKAGVLLRDLTEAHREELVRLRPLLSDLLDSLGG